VLACLVAAGAVGPADASAATTPVSPAISPEAQDELARASAEAEAAAMVAAVQLPGGSVRMALEPAGDGNALANPPPSPPGGFPAVEEIGWASVPEPSSSLLAYLHEHPPAGATVESFFYPPTQVPNPAQVVLRFPPRTVGPISETETRITLLERAGGTTDVRIRALTLWVPTPRPIPAGAKLLRVKTDFRRPPRIRTTRTLTVPRKIEAVRMTINALPVPRPSLLVRSCPASSGHISLAFYMNREARGTPLARVNIAIGGCGGVSSTIRGVEAPSRQGLPAVRPLATVLGIKIPGY
jgi:hypothetical protein